MNGTRFTRKNCNETQDKEVLVDVSAFRAWQLNGNRHVSITMGEAGNKEKFSIWVYDYDLRIGQFVTSVYEIDLRSARIAELERDLEELAMLEAFKVMGEGK